MTVISLYSLLKQSVSLNDDNNKINKKERIQRHKDSAGWGGEEESRSMLLSHFTGFIAYIPLSFRIDDNGGLNWKEDGLSFSLTCLPFM